jgi:DNA (cytosine-5)-methyltransferase 1
MTVDIRAVDLFCGVGGLTRGLLDAGLGVKLGVDIKPACQFPYEANNSVPFLLKNVEILKARELRAALRGADVSVLAGCAPCQAFSTYNVRRGHRIPNKFSLVRRFATLIDEVRPDIVTMENVPYLRRRDAFRSFYVGLVEAGYHVWHDIVDVRHYGVPQTRKRLVLLASRLGDIRLVSPTHLKESRWRTVRQAISGLPRIRAGGQDPRDPLHVASKLSPLNMARMLASRPGKSWQDWPESLRARCHTKTRGERYVSVYGRMEWDRPAPTITTQSFGFGSGRFGHPEQNRAISLREAALLQTFHRSYRFIPDGHPVRVGELGELIGNAVPVRLGEIIGRSIAQSVRERDLRANTRRGST